MRAVTIFLFLITCLYSCSKKMERNNWEENNYKLLNELITEYSKSDDSTNNYAVFDFDNTTIINDITINTCYYQIYNLLFKIKPEELYPALINGIDEDSQIYNLAKDISQDYNFLYNNYISIYNINPIGTESLDKSNALAKIHGSKEYKSFSTKLWYLIQLIYTKYDKDYSFACNWQLVLFKGMTSQDLQELSKNAAKWAMAKESLTIEKWTCPINNGKDSLSVQIPIGIRLTKSMRNLYKTLLNNNIDVYICTASYESIVQAFACSEDFGLNLKTENVIGVKLNTNSDNFISSVDTKAIISYKEGKTAAIKKYIASLHNGKDPILVAGDSNGDYNMLVDFPNLRIGLIINLNKKGKLTELYKKARTQTNTGLQKESRYILQGRSYQLGDFIKDTNSIN